MQPKSSKPTPEPNFDPLVDEKPSRYVVGIDLGTTNSAVTYVDTHESPWQIRILSIPQIVAPGQVESLDTLPSFYFQPPSTGNLGNTFNLPWDKKSARFCVGAHARDESAKTSGRTIASAKSWLCNAAVDRTAELLPWQGADDVKRLSPVEASGHYLRHIRKSWDLQFSQCLLADQDIVLTLPASFDEVARELTIEAAKSAGLNRVVLVEEPQAAFYAWVYKHADDWEQLVEIGQKILVCDIGGGTTDFTLIRVRRPQDPGTDPSSGSTTAQRIQFHRVAVGQHLILGGDNLDLAIAKHIEQKLLADGQSLEPYQWEVLVGTSRNIKEQLLSKATQLDEETHSSPDTAITVTLPSRGSKLIGGSLSTTVSQEEIQSLIVDGFLPQINLNEKPQLQSSGFQEFGLPYASDPAITRYLADFLLTHAEAGLEATAEAGSISQTELARPDVVLFNGGFFASPLLRDIVIDRINGWFSDDNTSHDYRVGVLDNDRLDLAVARGAAYYGMVRRDMGVRIAASLARSYYLDVGGGRAVCVMPGSAQPGETFTLSDHQLLLTISQPVEFSVYVSSVRLADTPGQIVDIDPQQLRALPPIRTVLKAKSKNEKRDVPVVLQAALTEIGTIDLTCQQVDNDRSWRLQFDVRSATQTDTQAHQSDGEAGGFIDDQTWQRCQQVIHNVFGEKSANPAAGDPNLLIEQLTEVLDAPKEAWPMSVLRRIWESLMEQQAGRTKNARTEARWLNLLGYSLRPGYGVALDDWRVTETWRHVRGKLHHGSPNIIKESNVLWRRLSGGLSAGQQSAIAQPLIASLKALAQQAAGKRIKGNAVALKPEESIEAWRLLGSLERLPVAEKIGLATMILQLVDKPKLASARSAMVWTLGRLGQRVPVYSPLNTVVGTDQVNGWLTQWIQRTETTPVDHLAVVQMARRVDDRYRDIDHSLRGNVIKWLTDQEAAPSLIRLVSDGGSFDSETKAQVFGESLPPGLRLA